MNRGETLVVVPTWPMALVAVTHFALHNLKARNEEAHLARLHGASYVQYMQRTGRFVPRFTARAH